MSRTHTLETERLLYDAVRLIKSVQEDLPFVKGVIAGGLLLRVQALDPERYDREVKGHGYPTDASQITPIATPQVVIDACQAEMRKRATR